MAQGERKKDSTMIIFFCILSSGYLSICGSLLSFSLGSSPYYFKSFDLRKRLLIYEQEQ